MSSHVRVLAFCLSLLLAPFIWELGQQLAGDVAGVLLPAAVVTATAIWAQAGQRKPPAGTRPA